MFISNKDFDRIHACLTQNNTDPCGMQYHIGPELYKLLRVNPHTYRNVNNGQVVSQEGLLSSVEFRLVRRLIYIPGSDGITLSQINQEVFHNIDQNDAADVVFVLDDEISPTFTQVVIDHLLGNNLPYVLYTSGKNKYKNLPKYQYERAAYLQVLHNVYGDEDWAKSITGNTDDVLETGYMQEFNIGHYHEMLDRIHVQRDHIENALNLHPATTKHPYLQKKLHEIQALMGKMYQYVGMKLFEMEKDNDK